MILKEGKGQKPRNRIAWNIWKKAGVCRKEHILADPLLLAQNDQCQTSVLLSCKITYLCCFKPLHFWQHLAAAVHEVKSPSHIQFFATPWTAAHQASLAIATSRSLLKLMSSKSVMPSNHLILCHPLLLLPSIFPSIRVFSSESVLRIR